MTNGRLRQGSKEWLRLWMRTVAWWDGMGYGQPYLGGRHAASHVPLSFTLAAPAAALTMRAEYIASMAVRDCARVSVREGTLACVKDTWKERKKVTYARTGDSVMS